MAPRKKKVAEETKVEGSELPEASEAMFKTLRMVRNEDMEHEESK